MNDTRFLVVTDRDGTTEKLDRYLYSGCTIVRSWALEGFAGPTLLAVVECRDHRLADQLSQRLGSGLITTWTIAGNLDSALAETVVVRAELELVELVEEQPQSCFDGTCDHGEDEHNADALNDPCDACNAGRDEECHPGCLGRALEQEHDGEYGCPCAPCTEDRALDDDQGTTLDQANAYLRSVGVLPQVEPDTAPQQAAARLRILLASIDQGDEVGPLSPWEVDCIRTLVAYAEGPDAAAAACTHEDFDSVGAYDTCNDCGESVRRQSQEP